MSKNLMGVIQFLQQNFKGQPTIFVGCKNNDQFIVNQPVIYFLTNSQYSTKYHHFEPGVITTPEVQKEIVSELKRYDVEAIVLDTGYWYEENETKYDDHLDILDDFIKNTYVLVREFGDYQVLLKK